jgi:mxaK protein
VSGIAFETFADKAEPAPASRWRDFAHRSASLLAAARTGLLWTALCASGAAFLIASSVYLRQAQTNAEIERLHAGKDIAIDAASAPPALLAARQAFLLQRDRIEDAQPLLDQAILRAPADVQVRMLYNMGNAHLRAAIEAVRKGTFDKAIPLVALAKSEYRSALRLNPGDWNARYNFDVAMRLVRDLPPGEAVDEKDPLKTPEKLWTDLPGIPEGLP